MQGRTSFMRLELFERRVDFAIVANAVKNMLMGYFELGVDELVCAKFIDLDQDYHLVVLAIPDSD